LLSLPLVFCGSARGKCGHLMEVIRVFFLPKCNRLLPALVRAIQAGHSVVQQQGKSVFCRAQSRSINKSEYASFVSVKNCMQSAKLSLRDNLWHSPTSTLQFYCRRAVANLTIATKRETDSLLSHGHSHPQMKEGPSLRSRGFAGHREGKKRTPPLSRRKVYICPCKLWLPLNLDFSCAWTKTCSARPETDRQIRPRLTRRRSPIPVLR
jgi:hypothetical protein